MKQFWLGLAVCSLIASSCQMNEVTDFNTSHPDLIGFSTSTGKTKAVSNDLAALQGSTSGFNVYVTHKSPAVAFAKIDNKAYKYTTGKWAWEGEGVMWPSVITDYPMNFYAVYPKETWTFTPALDGYSYTVKGTSAEALVTTPASQEDILVAQMTNVKNRPASSNVTLDFKHILSKIDFKVVPGKNTKVYLQSIVIRKVERTGSYSYKTNAWTPGASYTHDFTFLPKVSGLGLLFDGAASTETVASAMVVSNTPYGSLMLMPQNASANKWVPGTGDKTAQTMIEVVYRITDAAGAPIVGFADATDYPGAPGSTTGALFIKAGFPLAANWESGKAYTYNLFLGTANSSGGNLVDDNFVDEDGNQTNLPVKDPEGGDIDPDKPVIDADKPIGFTVSVSGWDTANNPEVK